MELDRLLSREDVEVWNRARDFGGEDERLVGQEILRGNFGAFCWMLGYRDLGEFHLEQLGEISKIRDLDDVPVRRLWLWSRGFFKTSLITEAHSVWLMCRNPNVRILLVSFTIEVAEKPLQAIRNIFVGNPMFRWYFREWCPVANKDGKIEFGTTRALTVPNRTKNLKEPTVMCAGVGTNITGLHFDVQKIDDLVTKDSVTNDTQIQASKDYFSLLGPIFDKIAVPRQDVIGTIYHFNDLHSQLLKNKQFTSSVIPVHDENYVFKFPERLDQKQFEERVLGDPSNNPYDVQSQYLLNPINPAEAKFRDEWWQTYDELPDGLSEYVMCDPASVVKKKADYTVGMRWGFDADMNCYLLEGYRDKLRADQRVARYVRMSQNAKRLKGAIYEVIGGRHGDLENIRDEFLAKKLPCTPRETKSTSSSKQDRIEQRLVGQWHAKKVFLPRTLVYRSEFDGSTHDFVQEYKLEFLQFPFSEHDDILDCHAQLFDGEFIMKGDGVKKEVKKEDRFDWWREQAMKSKMLHRRRYIFGNKNKHRNEVPSLQGCN